MIEELAQDHGIEVNELLTQERLKVTSTWEKDSGSCFHCSVDRLRAWTARVALPQDRFSVSKGPTGWQPSRPWVLGTVHTLCAVGLLLFRIHLRGFLKLCLLTLKWFFSFLCSFQAGWMAQFPTEV